MTVRFFPTRELHKSSLIQGFFSRHKVKYELVNPTEETERPWVHSERDLPAVEVDGRLFVNPNDDALKKILHLE